MFIKTITVFYLDKEKVEDVEVKEEKGTMEEVVSCSEDYDWEMIQSLENKKYDKVKLEKHVLEVSGGTINLNRRKTLENMINELKEALK